jgi:hypothetical protein
MRAADVPGLLAAFFVAFVGFSSMLFLRNVSAPLVAEQTSYIGGISIEPPEGQAPPAYEDNPYNIEAHRGSSTGETVLDILALLSIAMLGGATGARVGNPIRARRGAIGVALGAACLILWNVASSQSVRPDAETVTAVLLFALVAGAFGGLGGLLVKGIAARSGRE